MTGRGCHRCPRGLRKLMQFPSLEAWSSAVVVVLDSKFKKFGFCRRKLKKVPRPNKEGCETTWYLRVLCRRKRLTWYRKKWRGFDLGLSVFSLNLGTWNKTNSYLQYRLSFTSQEEHIMKLTELAARGVQSWQNTHFWWMKYQTKLCKNKEQTRSWLWNYTPQIYLAVALHPGRCLLLTSIKPLVP